MKALIIAVLAAASFGFTLVKNERNGDNPPTGSAGVYLYAEATGSVTYDITKGTGNSSNGHLDEVAVLAGADGMEASLTLGGGGSGLSQPQIAPLVLSKQYDRSSARFKRALLQGHTVLAELRYYDGVLNTPVYVVKLTNGFVTSFTSASDATCAGLCPNANESLAIAPAGTISWTNNKTSTPQVITYNVQTGNTSFSGL